jgi:hypothetical protein
MGLACYSMTSDYLPEFPLAGKLRAGTGVDANLGRAILNLAPSQAICT